ncbi:MAG: glycosyltransferase [Lachnospiraceae bacterium]|nr:glycosyltransferase [Lachnospiraceae bacterium]
MKKPKVSVIMGVYNPQMQRLIAAVDSLIRQSFIDWELIIWDDGSDLVYATQIAALSKRDFRIVCGRSERNQGLAKALNHCIRIAKGDYIARMDDDDISLRFRLEKQFDYMEQQKDIAWVGTSAFLMDGNSIWGVRRMKEAPDAKDFLKYSPYIHPSVMFRKKVLLACKGYNNAEITRRCEDYELFMRLHMAGYQGRNMTEYLFVYREDSKSYVRRTCSARVSEMKVRYWGFQKMGILEARTVPYIFRPLLGFLIPAKWLVKIKRDEKT